MFGMVKLAFLFVPSVPSSCLASRRVAQAKCVTALALLLKPNNSAMASLVPTSPARGQPTSVKSRAILSLCFLGYR